MDARVSALQVGCALNYQNLNVLSQLVHYEKDLQDANGRTAVDYARVGERKEVLALLGAQ